MSEIVSIVILIVALISMRVHLLKGLNLGEGSFNLRLHISVGIIGGCKFGFMLGGGGCAFIFVDLESRHNLIYDGVGVVESKCVNRSAGLSDIKVSFSKVVFEIFPSLLRQSGAFHARVSFLKFCCLCRIPRARLIV